MKTTLYAILAASFAAALAHLCGWHVPTLAAAAAGVVLIYTGLRGWK